MTDNQQQLEEDFAKPIPLTHYEAALCHYVLGNHPGEHGHNNDPAHNAMIDAIESARAKLVEAWGEFVVLA
jgi:hypothetical protein